MGAASEFEEAYTDELEAHEKSDAQTLGESILRESCGGVGIHEAVTVSPSTTIRQAIEVMVRNRVGCVLVVEGKRLQGIFSERDVMTRVVHKGIDHGRPVASVMTPDPEVVGPNDPLVFLLNRMVDGGYRHVPVVDLQRQPLGVVSVRGIVEWVVAHCPGAVLNLPPRASETYPPRIDGD